MFPDAKRNPPGSVEDLIRLGIAADIPHQLLDPPLSVALGQLAVNRTPMPIAPIHEYRDTDTTVASAAQAYLPTVAASLARLCL